MNLRILKPGHKVKLRDGAVARILAETGDRNLNRVEYLESGGAPSPVGAEAMVDEREIEALLGVAHPRTWGEEATAILHHVPESEDSEAGCEAVTMKGGCRRVRFHDLRHTFAAIALTNGQVPLGLQYLPVVC